MQSVETTPRRKPFQEVGNSPAMHPCVIKTTPSKSDCATNAVALFADHNSSAVSSSASVSGSVNVLPRFDGSSQTTPVRSSASCGPGSRLSSRKKQPSSAKRSCVFGDSNVLGAGDEFDSLPQTSPGRIQCEKCEKETFVRKITILEECNHCVCSECIDQHLRRYEKTTCPVCDVQVSIKELGPIFESYLEAKFLALLDHPSSSSSSSSVSSVSASVTNVVDSLLASAETTTAAITVRNGQSIDEAQHDSLKLVRCPKQGCGCVFEPLPAAPCLSPSLHSRKAKQEVPRITLLQRLNCCRRGHHHHGEQGHGPNHAHVHDHNQNQNQNQNMRTQSNADAVELVSEQPSPLAGETISSVAIDKQRKENHDQNRFRCRECATEFCASCKAMPFHHNLTCEEYRQTLVAQKCRWCQIPISGPLAKKADLAAALPSEQQQHAPTPPSAYSSGYPSSSGSSSVFAERLSNASQKPPVPRLYRPADCCSSKECQLRSSISCSATLDCGHACGGVRGEKDHLECLACSQMGEDFCNICWTETFSASPSVQLKCGHVFHYMCIRKRLQKAWHTAHISFGFLQCPLCTKDIDHDSLRKYLAPHWKLREDVKSKALERAAVEQYKLAEDEDPLRHFMYYMCAECEQPYFGGMKQCMAAVEEEVVEDDESGDADGTGDNNNEHADRGSVGVSLERKAQEVDGGDRGGVFASLKAWLKKKFCKGVDTVSLEPNKRRINRKELICGSCVAGNRPEAICMTHGKRFIEYKCRYCCNIANWYCWGNTHFCDSCHTRQDRGDYVTKYNIKDLPRCPGPRLCPTQMKHPPAGQEFLLGCAICRHLGKF
eukprot:ANDGO_00116.mRNA.1 E3 ubiquitin-protein ligase highwire